MPAGSSAPAVDDFVDQYDRDGYCVLRSVFAAGEIAALSAECETLVGRHESIDGKDIRYRSRSSRR